VTHQIILYQKNLHANNPLIRSENAFSPDAFCGVGINSRRAPANRHRAGVLLVEFHDIEYFDGVEILSIMIITHLVTKCGHEI
jgi:hypothetical protein